MKISNKLCISNNWWITEQDGNKIIDICAFDDCQFHESDEDIKDDKFDRTLPVPKWFKKSNEAYKYILIFKRNSKGSHIVGFYHKGNSTLYTANGKKASKKDFRRFTKLLCNAWVNC